MTCTIVDVLRPMFLSIALCDVGQEPRQLVMGALRHEGNVFAASVEIKRYNQALINEAKGQIGDEIARLVTEYEVVK